MSNEVAIVQQAPMELSVVDVRNQVVKIQELMASVMKDGEHYGVIPGTNKPSLYKAGAEKIGFIFRLAPEYQIERDDLPNGHREYRVVCRLRHMGTGSLVGEGVGSCSTMESKYRYRNEAVTEEVGVVSKAYWDTDKENFKAREAVLVKEFGPGKYKTKKVDGQWKVFKVTGDGRIENPDIADLYNTVLKMAKKRAFVDATITASAASDFFTQDVEDFADTPAPRTAERSQESRQEPRQAVQDAPTETSAPPAPELKKASSLVPTKRQQVMAYIKEFEGAFTAAQLDTLREDMRHAGTTDALLDAVLAKAEGYMAGPADKVSGPVAKMQADLDAEAAAMNAGFGDEAQPGLEIF